MALRHLKGNSPLKHKKKISKKVEKVTKQVSKNWKDIEDFRKSVSESGLALNVEEEYEFFKSDPENFKKTNTYQKLK